MLGFFVVILDAVVVNLALPSIRVGIGGGITGLQWVVDGYTLLFAALLLSSGSLADRVGARRAFSIGIALFVVASIACGAAPTLPLLVVARSVAATSGPVFGRLLTMLDWRLIFFVNAPVGVVALLLLRRTAPAPRWSVPFDWFGQVTAVVATASITYAAIEAGSAGLIAPRVLIALGLAVLGLIGFLVSQGRVPHPLVPLGMFGSRTFRIALGTRFAFMVGYYGLPFVFSLYLQEERGLTALGTGIAFLPMMLIGLALTPFSARIVECVGARLTVSVGLAAMTIGLATLALLPATTALWLLSVLMVLVGLGGPLTMPPMTAGLLNHVPSQRTGMTSGAFNTSRQAGGAMAVAVFGGLLANNDCMSGLRASLLIAAAVLLVTTLASLRCHGSDQPAHSDDEDRTGYPTTSGTGRHT